MSATLAHSTSRAQSAVNFNFRNDKGLRETAESVQDRGREHATFCNHVLYCRLLFDVKHLEGLQGSCKPGIHVVCSCLTHDVWGPTCTRKQPFGK